MGIGLRNGDIINVRATNSSRIVCSPEDVGILRTRKTNLHYIEEPVIVDVANYELPKRITIKFVDTFGMEMAITIRDNTEVGDMMEAFAKFARKPARKMRFHCEDEGVVASSTLRKVSRAIQPQPLVLAKER